MGAGGLGAVWLVGDLGLDRIDIDGRPAVVGLAAAGCAGVALAAVLSRGGAPSRSGRHLAAGTAAVLAVAPMTITTPWDKPAEAFEVSVENTLTTMKLATAVAFLAVTVAMLAPALDTVRSRWLVPVWAAVTLVAAVPMIVDEPSINFAAWGVVVLAATIAPPLRDVRVARLLATGVITIVLTPVLALATFLLVSLHLGRAMTSLAGNPPVQAADSDIAVTLSMALLGLALAAVSLAVVRDRGPVPVPVTS